MEYDQSATRAEALEVSEVWNTKDMIRDFLDAVKKVVPNWVATFSGPGCNKAAMDRKKAMKLFREHIS